MGILALITGHNNEQELRWSIHEHSIYLANGSLCCVSDGVSISRIIKDGIGMVWYVAEYFTSFSADRKRVYGDVFDGQYTKPERL